MSHHPFGTLYTILQHQVTLCSVVLLVACSTSQYECAYVGRCWVSIFCFPPKELLAVGLSPMIQQVQNNLQIFYNTVLKSAQTSPSSSGDTITSVTAIQRTVKAGVPCGGYDVRPSQDITDWYDHRFH
jgi:hypothetical protein